MSWILGIDTSSIELSIGLIKKGKAPTTYSRYVPNSHAEHITTAVNFIFRSTGITAADISHAGVAVGPGSFTGLRIGISFIKGFFLRREIPILPVSSLQAMSTSLHVKDCSVISAMDARQNKVFCAAFEKDNGKCKRVSEDELLSKEEFYNSLEKESLIVFDSLGYSKSSVFDSLKTQKIGYNANEVPLQRGLACALIASDMIGESAVWKKSTEILPNYMQPSYAEKKCSS